jgi:hypothetical protein
MIFNVFKKFFSKLKQEKQEDFDKLYKANQNIKSENYEIPKYVPMIKKLKK